MFYRYSQGLTSDTWNLKYHHFAQIKVSIPDKDEQIEIVKILSLFDQEIKLLNEELELYKIQKQGLKQKLLTGKWRVKVED
jgi:type I restriction enzyme S subunit